jgi:metal-dependent HD superfamily phosphatase/phosphodiesterase
MDSKIIHAIKNLGLSERVLEAARLITADDEVQAIQEYANNVSIVRLGFNDHGPVHMRTVALNVIIMLGLLRQAGIKTSLETEGVGDFEDSLIATVYASMLHDLGMSIGRQDHEIHSTYMAAPILDRILPCVYKDEKPGADGTQRGLQKKVMVRCLALEGISGHMGNRTIHSLEAGVVQIADGCDMTKGRARIPIALGNNPRGGGHIHQYSANSIENVKLSEGEEKPIRIKVSMSSEVGFFQVEEVLLHKIASSTAKPYIELYAQVKGGQTKKYL